MNDLPAVRLPDRVLNARYFQIECMVVGQGQQVKTEGCQRIERFRRSEKSPTLVDRLTFFGDCGFKVGEHHIALQQLLDHWYCRRCGRPDIRPDHRLPRQGDRYWSLMGAL